MARDLVVEVLQAGPGTPKEASSHHSWAASGLSRRNACFTGALGYRLSKILILRTIVHDTRVEPGWCSNGMHDSDCHTRGQSPGLLECSIRHTRWHQRWHAVPLIQPVISILD